MPKAVAAAAARALRSRLTRAQPRARPPPLALRSSLYDAPKLYDAVFGPAFRDFDAEAEGVVRLAALLSDRRPASALELGCGPGRHSHAFARLGLSALGLDASPAMVAYAQTIAQPATALPAATFAVGDMRHPAAAAAVAAAAPFDIVTCLCATLGHCTAAGDADVLAVLRSARRLLSPQGVLVIELPHPAPLFGGRVTGAAVRDGGDDGAWSVPGWDAPTGDPGGGAVSVQWGAPGDAWCPLTQVLRRTVTVTSPPGRGPPLRDVVPTRLFGCPELRLLAALAGLRVAAVEARGLERAGEPGGCGEPGEGGEEAEDEEEEEPHTLVMALARADPPQQQPGG